MSYRSQRSSRRNSGRGRGKVQHEKSKRKARKHRSRNQRLLEASETLCLEEIANKTLERLSNLGIQTFAFSPFSQYFRDWLLSLKNVISEFESNPNVRIDEEFIEKRSQLVSDIELKLSKRQREEDVLENATRMLTKQRSLLVQTDTEFSYALQELVSERKSEIKRLNRKIRILKKDLRVANQVKVSIFNPIAKRSKSHRKTELNRKLDSAKSELELIEKEIEAKQEKLSAAYEEKKKTLIEKVRCLKEKIGTSETDNSIEDRRVVCEGLRKTVKALLQRNRAAL